MNQSLEFFLDFVLGGLLGTFFFLGLWWTVRKIIAAELSGLGALGSLVLRTGVTVAGFYLICVYRVEPHWERWVACLAGFSLARFCVKRWLEARGSQEGYAPQP